VHSYIKYISVTGHEEALDFTESYKYPMHQEILNSAALQKLKEDNESTAYYFHLIV
jgi:hypothetical protein